MSGEKRAHALSLPVSFFAHTVEHLNRGLIHPICGVETSPQQLLPGVLGAHAAGFRRLTSVSVSERMQYACARSYASVNALRHLAVRCLCSLFKSERQRWRRSFSSLIGGIWCLFCFDVDAQIFFAVTLNS